MSLEKRLSGEGAKRILSLDGGGIRGALTIGYLEKIEAIIRQRHCNPNMLLCDYFDLIGGTSTGAIISACLAKGMNVEEVKAKYLKLGGEIFKEKNRWFLRPDKWILASYKNEVLIRELENTFDDITLGNSELKTGLAITLKRADSNSTWFLLNHPTGKYYEVNKNIKIATALAAAAAAPSYFPPQEIHVGGGQNACFIDGGVSLSNNPALGLLQVATLKGFPFKWKMGADNLLLVSVGTGYGDIGMIPSTIAGKTKVFWGKNIADFYMQDANWETQAMLQWLSDSPTAKEIDSMRGILLHDQIGGTPLLSYLRYNIEISQNSLRSLTLGAPYTTVRFGSKDVKRLLDMSNAKNRQLLYEIGRAASAEILPQHFPHNFNIL